MKELKNILPGALNQKANQGSKDVMFCQLNRPSRPQTNEQKFFDFAPLKYQKASLETCDKQPQEYIDFGRNWAKNPTSLFLTGNIGSGKTQFAFALIRELFKYYPMMWPRYYTSPKLDERLLEAVTSPGGDRCEITYRSEEDLLFLDDVGRETKSPRLLRQYFEILNNRYANHKLTILTSNLSLEKLGDIIDPAIASRVQEWQIIEFVGEDLRKYDETRSQQKVIVGF